MVESLKNNPFRENLPKVRPPNYFEQSGSRNILYKGEMQSPNFVHQKKGWKISSDGDAEFQKIHIGSQLITLAPGDSLQAAIDDLSQGDGGHIFLQSGTYTITSTLNLKSAIQIEGENTSTTIIDFNDTSAQLKATGTNIYTTGTIVAITNSVILTGSGTTWLGNVTTDHQIFLGNKWYKISAITGDTTIILSEGYTGGATLPATYRAVKVIKDIEIKDVSIKNSTGTALDLDDVRDIVLDDILFEGNNKGFVFDNVSEILIDQVIVVTSDSNGVEFNTCGFADIESLATIANSGHGCVINNVRIWTQIVSASNANTSDGYNITSAKILQLNVESSNNGGQGIEFVSGNIGCFIYDSICQTNTSDGIKSTATSDDIIISATQIIDNGGYGVNIAAATCDSNLINGCIFDDNTSGAVNNSGTNTKIVGNIGVADDPASTTATYKNGTETRAGDSASGGQTIAHGLGTTPKYVRITAWKVVPELNIHQSVGVYNGTTTSCIFITLNSGSSGTQTGNDSTNIVNLDDSGDAGNNNQVATIAVDATNITLTWTKAGTPSADNIQILWEAIS